MGFHEMIIEPSVHNIYFSDGTTFLISAVVHSDEEHIVSWHTSMDISGTLEYPKGHLFTPLESMVMLRLDVIDALPEDPLIADFVRERLKDIRDGDDESKGKGGET